MSKRKHRRADRQLTRRYVERTVRRARDEIIRAVLWATVPVAEPTVETYLHGTEGR